MSKREFCIGDINGFILCHGSDEKQDMGFTQLTNDLLYIPNLYNYAILTCERLLQLHYEANGYGYCGIWVLDIEKILCTGALIKEEDDNILVDASILLMEIIMIEEIIHSIGPKHYSNNENWTNFFMDMNLHIIDY